MNLRLISKKLLQVMSPWRSFWYLSFMLIRTCIFLSLITVANAFGNELLEYHCALAGGKVVKRMSCTKSKIPLPWKFCVAKDASGKKLFFDGCTGPSGGYSAIFYPACIQHDHCYHHEPVSNGLSRRDCDKRFLEQMSVRCDNAKDKGNCLFWARTMYRAVRTGGIAAFNCAKYDADYE